MLECSRQYLDNSKHFQFFYINASKACQQFYFADIEQLQKSQIHDTEISIDSLTSHFGVCDEYIKGG